MTDNWDDYAEGWDTNEDVREYSGKAFSELLKVTDLEGLRILDFGCGTGLLIEKMAPFADSIIALDASEKMCAVLKKKSLINVDVVTEYLTDDLVQKEPLLQQPFDLIVASSVLAFIDDVEGTLRLLKTLLHNKGVLVHWDWKKTEKEPDFGFDAEYLENVYEKAGLHVVSVSESFSLESEHGQMDVLMGIAEKAH